MEAVKLQCIYVYTQAYTELHKNTGLILSN